MVLLIEKEVVTAFESVPGKISDHAASIQVRKDPAERNQSAVAKIVSRFGCYQPTGK